MGRVLCRIIQGLDLTRVITDGALTALPCLIQWSAVFLEKRFLSIFFPHKAASFNFLQFQTGISDFIKQPPNTLDVTEGSNLQLRIEMDGNPQPSADFRWPHLTGSSPTNVPSVQLYPFVYSSTYTMNNIDTSYCGRILHTTLRNNIGLSVTASTNVTLLCKFTSLVLKHSLFFTGQFRAAYAIQKL